MSIVPWAKEFPAAITVCDAAGVILEMNDLAAAAFEKDGGRRLVGANLLDCHPEPSRTQVREMLAGLGYAAFACDMYGKGVRPQNPTEASAEAGKFYKDRSLFRSRAGRYRAASRSSRISGRPRHSHLVGIFCAGSSSCCAA